MAAPTSKLRSNSKRSRCLPSTPCSLPLLVQWLSNQKSAQIYVAADGSFKLRLLESGRYGKPVCGNTFEEVITKAMNTEASRDEGGATDRAKLETEMPQPDPDGWIPHRPGDPMPCFDDKIEVRYRNGETENGYTYSFCWGKQFPFSPEYSIIAWKPA